MINPICVLWVSFEQCHCLTTGSFWISDTPYLEDLDRVSCSSLCCSRVGVLHRGSSPAAVVCPAIQIEEKATAVSSLLPSIKNFWAYSTLFLTRKFRLTPAVTLSISTVESTVPRSGCILCWCTSRNAGVVVLVRAVATVLTILKLALHVWSFGILGSYLVGRRLPISNTPPLSISWW